MDTDFDSLARELRGQSGESEPDDYAAVPEPYVDLLKKYGDDDYVEFDEDERRA